MYFLCFIYMNRTILSYLIQRGGYAGLFNNSSYLLNPQTYLEMCRCAKKNPDYFFLEPFLKWTGRTFLHEWSYHQIFNIHFTFLLDWFTHWGLLSCCKFANLLEFFQIWYAFWFIQWLAWLQKLWRILHSRINCKLS